MKTLNDRYDYGLDLFLLSIDEGITGYRDDSLEVSQSNELTLFPPSFLSSGTDESVCWGWGLSADCEAKSSAVRPSVEDSELR